MPRTYTTISGDMWDLIAYRELGSETYMDALLNLNRRYAEIVAFPAGIELVLPEPIEEKPEGLPPWKEMLYDKG